MSSLSGNYTDGYKFCKNDDGAICVRNIDGSYLSVAKSMPFDKLLEMESKSVPIVDSVVENKYTSKNELSKQENLIKIKIQRKPIVVKPSFKKANKRVRGKIGFYDFYVCVFCGTHHTDETEECADCISNYEKDMKYTNTRILEISNDNTLNDDVYYDFISNIKEYLDSEDFRGFRRIDVVNFNKYSNIFIYFIDTNNKMVSKTIWATYYDDKCCCPDCPDCLYDIDDYIEYEDHVDMY